MTVTKEKLEATIKAHHAKIADAQATINQFQEGIVQKTSAIQQAVGAINLATVILAELEAEEKKAADDKKSLDVDKTPVKKEPKQYADAVNKSKDAATTGG